MKKEYLSTGCSHPHHLHCRKKVRRMIMCPRPFELLQSLTSCLHCLGYQALTVTKQNVHHGITIATYLGVNYSKQSKIFILKFKGNSLKYCDLTKWNLTVPWSPQGESLCRLLLQFSPALFTFISIKFQQRHRTLVHNYIFQCCNRTGHHWAHRSWQTLPNKLSMSMDEGSL